MNGATPQHGAASKYLIVIPLAVVFFDRLTKHAVVEDIPMYHSVLVIPGVFRLTHSENTGAAFDLLRDSTAQWKRPALISFSLIALTVVLLLLWRNRHYLNLTTAALASIAGGATGNLWDRLVNGRVVDFLDVSVGTYHWYSFNVADSAIVVGAILLGLDIFLGRSDRGSESSTA